MTWAKLDDGFWRHPKIVGLTDRQFRLYVVALNWSCDQLTDGAITAADLPLVTAWLPISSTKRDKLALCSALVSARLWVETRDGWAIKGFEEFQPTRAQVHATRKAKQVAAEKGNHARWHTETPADDCRLCRRTASHTDRTSDAATDRTTIGSGNPPDPTRPDKTTTTPGRRLDHPPMVVAVAADFNIETAKLTAAALAELKAAEAAGRIRNARAVWSASMSQNRADLEAVARRLTAAASSCQCPNGPDLVEGVEDDHPVVYRIHRTQCPMNDAQRSARSQ